MKILFYNHTGRVSGAEHVLLMILQGLDRSRFDPVLLCPSEGALAELASRKVKTIEIDSLSARFTSRPDRLWNYLKSFVRVCRAARRAAIDEDPDIIHANSIRAGLVMSVATFGRRVPIVWHTHDILPRHVLSTAIRLFALCSRRNSILAVSRAVADRFRGLLLRPFKRRVPHIVVYNGIDLQHFYPDAEMRQAIRHELEIEDDQLVVGTIGQLTPRKGQLELINAFANIAGECPKALLLVIGEAIFNRDQDYAANLRQSVDSLALTNRVRFLGQRRDIPRLVRGLDCLVVNSKVEPFGLTVAEGMASETAVVANAVDGIPEVIRDGESGLLVSPDDQRQLIETLRRLLNDSDLRRKLGRQGRLDAGARFSHQRFLAEIDAVYRGLANVRELPELKTDKTLMIGALQTENRPPFSLSLTREGVSEL